MAVKNYKELIVWQRALSLVVEVYRVSRKFPKEEIYGLTNQIRRAAVSVPSNIAEGQGRGIGNEFAYHLRIALGSAQEVESQLLIAEKLGYVISADLDECLALKDEVIRLLKGLMKSLA